jgi:hypothetical protein
MNLLCTLYSHNSGINDFKTHISKAFKKAKIEQLKEEGLDVLKVKIPGSLFKKGFEFKVSYRQRQKDGYTLTRAECEYCRNLLGLINNYVIRIRSFDSDVKNNVVNKLKTINAEYNFITEGEPAKPVIDFIKNMAKEYQSLIMMLDDSPMLDVKGSAIFLNQNFEKIIDFNGKTHGGLVEISISSALEAQKKQDEINETERLKRVDAFFREKTEPEAYERKLRNEKILEQFNIPYNKSLPVIETSKTVQLRSKDEIINRILALELTISVADDLQASVARRQYDYILPYLSPKERILVFEDEIPEKDAHEVMFRLTALDALFWAIGLTDELPMHAMVGCQNEFEFDNNKLEQCTLRPVEEILNEADLAYRTHWVAVDARINGFKSPHVDGDVTYERLYALNWLIRNEPWDQVDTST